MSACVADRFWLVLGLVLGALAPALGQGARASRCEPGAAAVGGGAWETGRIESVGAFPGADIGAKMNAALADCPAAGCRVELPAGGYSFSTTVVVDKPVWIVGAGAVATRLRYTGTGDAIVVEAGGALPFLAGGLRGFGLVGTAAARAGVHQVDTVGFSYQDIAVGDFAGAGGAGIWMDNEAPLYCVNCRSGFSERTAFRRMSIYGNRVGVLWTSGSGVGSFEYTLMRGVHFQIGDGEVGMLLEGRVALQHSDVEFMANVWDPGMGATVVALRGGARWYQGRVMIAAEQTAGTAGIGFFVDAASYFDGQGSVILGALPNQVAHGGVYRLGVYGPATVLGEATANPAGGSSYPLNVDGNRIPGAAGFGDVLLAGAGAGAGVLNESLALGGFGAGLGVDVGRNVQHPFSWSYVDDPVAFAWYPKLSGADPVGGRPGAWLKAGSAWTFFADRFSSKSAGAARSGALALADGDAIAWRSHSGTGDAALTKDADDRLLWRGQRLAVAGDLPAVYAGGRELRGVHFVVGVVALAAGRAAVRLSAGERFLSRNSYVCIASDQTAAGPVRVANVSRGLFLLSGTGADRVGYQCVGN